MTTFERSLMIEELRNLTRTYVLKTDDEAAADRLRVAEICGDLGIEYPEDILDETEGF